MPAASPRSVRKVLPAPHPARENPRMAETRSEARLFVLAGPDLARSFPLGERTTLGRADECEVVLHDRSISRKHAEVVREGTRWYVQDLGSTNGISKDGARAERIELADGDEFRLGDLPLRFKLSTADEAQDIEFDLAPPASAAPAASKPAAASPKPAPRVRPGPASATEADEIQLEEPDEIQLE